MLLLYYYYNLYTLYARVLLRAHEHEDNDSKDSQPQCCSRYCTETPNLGNVTNVPGTAYPIVLFVVFWF